MLQPVRLPFPFALLALAAACGSSDSDPEPGKATVDETRALEEAAEMIEQQRLREAAAGLPKRRAGQQPQSQ